MIYNDILPSCFQCDMLWQQQPGRSGICRQMQKPGAPDWRGGFRSVFSESAEHCPHQCSCATITRTLLHFPGDAHFYLYLAWYSDHNVPAENTLSFYWIFSQISFFYLIAHDNLMYFGSSKWEATAAMGIRSSVWRRYKWGKHGLEYFLTCKPAGKMCQ